MKFADQTGITELITLTKTALKPLEAFKNSVTDVNGIVKSNGSGGFSAAVAGTDYAAASHTHTTSQVEGLSSAIAEAEPFVVTIQITTSSGGGKTYTADKTYAEIKAAIDAGKCCYAITTGLEMNILFPALVSSVGVLFTATQPDSASSVVMAILSDSSIIVQTYSTQPLIEATGLLKGDGQGTISAAVAGTDYAAANHTHDYLPLTGGTLTGNLTGKYITGTWLQTTATGDKAGRFATIDNDGWIYYRTPAETLADIGAASASHSHAAGDITSGTLPLTRGGTGATTASAARSALGAQATVVNKAGSLTVAGWSSKKQTISVAGVTASNCVIVAPAPASQEAYVAAGIKCTTQASGKLTFTCQSVPTAALTVNVAIL